jgi:hypothetical protein
MKIHTCDQGSPEWMQLRLGIPTSSSFDRIITPKTCKKSAQWDAYKYELIAERCIGHPQEEFMSWDMQRGKTEEINAVRLYELHNDMDTIPVGFITNDAGTIGASPDRLVGDNGLLEI